VAVLIRAFGGSVEEEVAALLHDCEEDCPGFDLDAALAYIFAGLLPARAVAGVREVIRALRHRDSEPNHVYFQRIIDAPPSTLKIKLYDRFDNVLGLADFTEERCRRYCAKTALLVRMMRDRAIILGMADLVAAIEEGASEALERLNAPARTGCTA
jgi:(p)ppGpp synthase/HD superfamily hydrolase